MPADPRDEHPPLGISFVIEYDAGDKAFPVIGISQDPRNALDLPAAYAAHPETELYPDHVFVGVKPTVDDQRSLWTYMILPGPWVYEKPISNDGVLVTVQKRKQKPSEITQGASATVNTESLEIDSYLAWERVTTLAEIFNRELRSKSSEIFLPKEFWISSVETESSDVTAGTDTTVSTPPPGGTNRKQRITDFTLSTTQITRDISAAEAVNDYQLTQYGISHTVKTQADAGAAAPTVNAMTYSAKSQDIGGGKSITEIEQLPATAEVIVSAETDPQTGIVINIEKWVVDPSTGLKGVVAGWFYDLAAAPWSSESAIQIRSQVDIATLPFTKASPEVFYTTANISLPDMLDSAAIDWESQGASAYSFDDNSADASATLHVSGGPKIQIKSGYRGPCVAKVTRYYTATAPSEADILAPTMIRASHGTIIIKTKGMSNQLRFSTTGASSGGSVRVGVQSHTFGPLLTNEVTLSTPSTSPSDLHSNADSGTGYVASAVASASGTATLAIPASVPVAMTNGNLILESARVERWRLNIYLVEIVEAIIPAIS